MQRDDPLLEARALLGRSSQRDLHGGAGALCKQSTQIGVAAFGDRAEPILAAGAVLSRYESEPSGELTTVTEIGGVAGGGDGGARGERADADDGADALGVGARFRVDVDLALAFLDSLVENVDLLAHLSDDRLESLGQCRARGELG